MSENLLLATLPRDERERLDPFLKWVEMPVFEVLIEPDEPIKNMFFPYDAITSTIQVLQDGSMIETGLMGIEGLIGIQLWLESPKTPTRTLIQVGGRGHLMSAQDFVREVRDKPEAPLNRLIARYVHAFLIMTSLVAACNRLHTVEARLCRWLKMTHNRIRRDEFQIRQEFLAQMLGVHRPTVSVAANALQKAGLITYSRGYMKILDPQGLADDTCECLELMEAQFDKIFDRPWRELAALEDRDNAIGSPAD